MRVNPTEFDHLLDPQQIEALLMLVVDVAPQVLFVLDSDGSILAQAQTLNIPAQLADQLPLLFDTHVSAPPIDPMYTLVRQKIVVEEQWVGSIVALSAAAHTQYLTATAKLVQQMLTQHAYKEYELNRLTSELLNKYEEINLLYELSQDLGVVFDIDIICNIALERALEVVKAQQAFIALMDDDEKNLTVVSARNMPGFPGWKIPVGQGVSGEVARSGRHVILQAQDALPGGSESGRLVLGTVLSVPLLLPATDLARGEDKVLGVMTLAGKPAGEIFTAGEAQLATTIMTQVTVAIYNSRLVKQLQSTERVQQQMEIASRIQQSLLPQYPPELPGIAVAGECLPTTKVGGDYYDYLVDREGQLNLLIADASGHSLGSALMITMTRSILRHELMRSRPLDRILFNINQVMLGDLVRAEMFISLFCARYNTATHQLTFVNAGHNPPLLQRAAKQNPEKLDGDTGVILGILETAIYKEHTILLNAGDILLLYTDGVTEARNPAGQQFGEKRLQELLKLHRFLPPHELQQHIYEAIRRHINGAEQHDDITMLILKIQEEV
jgi:serine phosphatase RsbU (regulator of sigma subunit)